MTTNIHHIYDADEPTLLDILKRDLYRAKDRQSIAEGKVNAAKLHFKQANAELDSARVSMEAASDEVQHLMRTIQVHELNAAKPKV